jgi:DNA-directed RNA polymerase I, II, and III subunit RPABC1
MEQQAVKILGEILKDRGYTIEYIDDCYSNLREYVIKVVYYPVNEQQVLPMCKIILGFICEESKLNIKGIKDKLSIMNKENSNHSIIVYRESVTSSAKKSLDIIDHKIELFSLNELQLNITKHRLVPVHEKVNGDDLLDLEKYKNKLPIILTSDPISRYYSYKKGDIIKITRKNGLVLYRQVK